MEPDGAMVHEYYRRAAELANGNWRRQDVTDTTSLSVESTSSVISTSSVASQSSASVSSTSTQSTSSTTSTSHTTSTSTTSLSSLTTTASSTFSSAIMTTDSSGHQYTTTIIIVPSNTPSQGSSNKSSNTGPIVGGVVGGIALIVLLALAVWLIRRKMRKDEFEANLFDPDRNVERPTSISISHPGQGFDLAGAGVGAAAGAGAGAAGGAALAASDRTSHVTPYSYAPTSTGPGSTYHGSSVAGAPEMSQAQSPVSSGYYSDYPNYAGNPAYAAYNTNYNQYQAMPSVGVGESFPNPYAPGYHPAANYGQQAAAGLGAAAIGAGAAGLTRGQTASASSTYPPTSEGRNSPSASPPMGAGATLGPAAAAPPLSARAAKEREAFGGRPGYAVSNPVEPAPQTPVGRNPSPTPSRNSGQNPMSPVTVHQDGGRVPDEEEEQGDTEIPPTYDSIPRETR